MPSLVRHSCSETTGGGSIICAYMLRRVLIFWVCVSIDEQFLAVMRSVPSAGGRLVVL